MAQDFASAERRAYLIREMARDRAHGNARGASDASSDRADAPGFGTESQQIPTLPQLTPNVKEPQEEWRINTSALRRAFPNFSQYGSSDEDSVEVGRGKRGIEATLKSQQSEDPSVSMSLTFPTTGERWKVTGTPPLKARKTPGDQAAHNSRKFRHASQKENVDPLVQTKSVADQRGENESDESASGVVESQRPAVNIAVRESRWSNRHKNPLGAANLATPNKSSGLPQAMQNATIDTVGSAQLQSFVLPDIPNITELVSGVRRDGTPLFSRSARPKSRFATPSMGKAQNARPSYASIDGVPIPADEKALFAALQILQEKVAGLESEKARMEKRSEDYELEVLQLRSKLEEIEANRHSDSGVGYDEEETKTKEWEHEKSQFAIDMKTLQRRLDRANKKLATSELAIKTLEKDRDAAHAQLMQAHLGSEELRTETQAVSEEISRAKKHVDKTNRQWERRLQTLTQQEAELRGKIARREKAVNEMAALAKDLWNTRNAMAEAKRSRAQGETAEQSNTRVPDQLRAKSRAPMATTRRDETVADSTMNLAPGIRHHLQEQDADYLSFMEGDEIAKLRQIVEDDRALLSKSVPPAANATLPRKSSLKQPFRGQPDNISVQFDGPVLRNERVRDDDPLSENITDIQQTTQQSIRSHRSRRSIADADVTSAIILPDITFTGTTWNGHRKRSTTIPRPNPVSDRILPDGEDHTLRPAQDPGVALAGVLKALEDEIASLRAQVNQQEALYHQHDPALSKRKRKSVFDRMQKLLATIELRSDQLYALYDVLEGQKAKGQLMDDSEIELTLLNAGIDVGFRRPRSSGTRTGMDPKTEVSPSEDTEDDEELPWEGFDTTHSLPSFKV